MSDPIFQTWINEMRAAGFAVVALPRDQLSGATPNAVEMEMLAAAEDAINNGAGSDE